MAAPEGNSDDNGANILLVVIVSIICINLLMIYKVFVEARKKSYNSNRTKHMILLVQAICDILVGLFPLNLRLHGLLDNPPMAKAPCWQRILAHTYLFHLMPFIHGVGIVLLVVESASFWRQQERNYNRQSGKGWFSLRSLLVSSLPLSLGAITLGPLVLIGFDFETCSVAKYSLFRIESFYFVSIIVPGLLAFVAACAYILSSMTRKRASLLSPADSTLVEQSTRFENGHFSHNNAIQANADGKKIESHHSKIVSDFSMSKSHYFDITKKCHECGKPLSLTDNNLQDNDDELLLDHGDPEEFFYTPPLSLKDLSSAIRWEKWNRLGAAILFIACSMPGTVLDLMYLSADADSSWPDTIRVTRGIEALYRLHVLRSLISPLIWFNEYS